MTILVLLIGTLFLQQFYTVLIAVFFRCHDGPVEFDDEIIERHNKTWKTGNELKSFLFKFSQSLIYFSVDLDCLKGPFRMRELFLTEGNASFFFF